MALNENDNDYNRLEELGGSDFEIAEGQSNIKGWKVKNAAGLNCGEVDELIFNPASRKVRYMVLDLNDNEFNLDSKKVLVPIGLATLHENDDEVYLAGITTGQLQGLPEYVEGQITPASELRLRNLLTGTGGAAGIAGSDDYTFHEKGFYEHDHFDEDRFYGNRRPFTNKPLPNQGENRSMGNRDPGTGGFGKTDEDSFNRRDDLL